MIGHSPIGEAQQFMSQFGRSVLVVALAASMLALAPSSPVAADSPDVVFQVDTNVDADVPGELDCQDGRPCSLRAAVRQANDQEPGTSVRIDLPAGSYVLDLGHLAVALDGEVAVQGDGADTTVIDGDQSDRHFFVEADAELILRDLTLTNGKPNGDGGAVYNEGTLQIVDSVLSDNESAGGHGGAIFEDSGNELVISDSVLERNLAGDEDGGAIYQASGATISITGSVFADNTSPHNGGAIRLSGSGVADITNSEFSGNVAEQGGAIRTAGGTINVTGSVIGDNVATSSNGGGLRVGSGEITVTDSHISGNIADGNGGGLRASSGTITVIASLLTDNHSTDSDGGAIRTVGGDVTVKDSLLTDNRAQGDGGAIRSSGGTITVKRSTLTGNESVGGRGGAVFGGGDIRVERSTLAENEATGSSGGAIRAEGDELDVVGTTISHNEALSDGGGIHADDDTTLTVEQSTISGNTVGSGARGGGLAARGATTLTFTTIAGNTAHDGGGGIDALPSAATVELEGTIIAGNTSVSGGDDCAGAGDYTSQGYNLDSDDSCGLDAVGDRPEQDPQLAPLADNGGLTLTHMPAASSPVVLGGPVDDVPVCADDAVDQRGVPRPVGHLCDIGAVEFTDVELTIDGPTAASVDEFAHYAVRLKNDHEDLAELVTVEFAVTRSGGIEEGDMELEWCADEPTPETAAECETWGALSLTHDEERDALVGQFGPSSGFPLLADHDATSLIRATFAVADTFTAVDRVLGVDSGFEYADASVAVDVTAPSAPAPAPVTVSDGDDLLTVTVTSPEGAPVHVEVVETGSAAPSGWVFAGSKAEIEAPDASVDDPIEIEFRLHVSQLGEGQGHADVAVLRDGVEVAECDDPEAGVAEPDPCVQSRETVGDEVVITVLTSQASTWHLAMPEVAVDPEPEACPPAAFPDVDPESVHVEAIGCAAFFDIAQGFADGTYGPAVPVRRDQMASFVARTLEAAGHSLPAGQHGFTDLDGNVHVDAVGRLAAAGIVEGTTVTTYSPAELVRRDQMAAFLVRALAWTLGAELAPSAGPYFADTAGSPHQDAIDVAFEQGLTAGRTADAYGPADAVRRDQMATFLIRLLDRLQ